MKRKSLKMEKRMRKKKRMRIISSLCSSSKMTKSEVESNREKVRMRGKSFHSKVAASRALLKRSFRESVLDEKSVREPRATAIEMPIKLRIIYSPNNLLFK